MSDHDPGAPAAAREGARAEDAGSQLIPITKLLEDLAVTKGAG